MHAYNVFYHSVEWLVMKSLRRLKMALRLDTQQIMKRKMNADFHAKLIPNWVAWSYNSGFTLQLIQPATTTLKQTTLKKITYCYNDLSP